VVISSLSSLHWKVVDALPSLSVHYNICLWDHFNIQRWILHTQGWDNGTSEKKQI